MTSSLRDRVGRSLAVIVSAAVLGLLLACACLLGASSASADGSWWRISSIGVPHNLAPGGEGTLMAFADNFGDLAVGAGEISLTDRVPVGLKVESVSFFAFSVESGKEDLSSSFCQIAGQVVSCHFPAELLPIDPYEYLSMHLRVKDEGIVAGAVNEIAVAGGGAPPQTLVKPIAVSSSPAAFGVEEYGLEAENENGGADFQAGSHPFQLSTALTLNQSSNTAAPPALVKDLNFKLPAGLVGNPTPFPQCTDLQFSTIESNALDLCPADTAVGAALVTVEEPGLLGLVTRPVPLFNLTPEIGEPARFGFEILGVPVILDTSLRTGEDYGVTVSVKNISELAGFISSRVVFWGVPGDPRHDSARGWSCIGGEREGASTPCAPLNEQQPPPLLTLPTSCGVRWHTSVEADSWSAPGEFLAPIEPPSDPTLDGCNHLSFSPTISAVPDGHAGSSPTGLTVGIRVPQQTALDATGLSPAEVRNTTVALPAGVGLNPSAADGLQACTDVAEPGRPEGEIGLGNPAKPTCPEQAEIGTVKIDTPLLPEPLEGAAYLAAQDANPFGSLLAIYIVADDPKAGALVKLAGKVEPDPITGQLVATFENTPQLPFEDLTLHFYGGDRAPLATPALCGSYSTLASIVPWSGGEAATASSAFEIASGPGGSPCSNPLPFAPSLNVGTASVEAGGFSALTMTMSRPDGDQDLRSVQLRMPPGLLGLVSSVKPCEEAQANAGTCGSESLIGHAIVSVGVGGSPYSVTGGEVFLTGPYEGAPYGLSIVNLAKAGPFDLGKVIVRAKIEVDPLTSVLTVSTNSAGPYSIPHILDGIPLQIQHVNVSIDRAGFIFNPTDCEKLTVGGGLESDQGTTTALSVPFQVTNCAALGFKPRLTARTSAKSSRARGTSLAIKLTYPKGAIGKEAWFKSAKFDFPKQLSARLKTLQQACPVATFNANPADCAPGSRVGTALVRTPVLPLALRGVVYFVSYAGLQFPEAVILLEGDNVTVDLHAETFISKQNVTSAILRAIPGVPFESVEVILPAGPFSEFAAVANLCAAAPRMDAALTAQDGQAIHSATALTVTGCSPSIVVLRHHVSGTTANILVSVPAAGTLTAGGVGLSRAVKKASARGSATISVSLTKRERQLLAAHPGRKLKAIVKLVFAPKRGGTLTKSLAVLLG